MLNPAARFIGVALPFLALPVIGAARADVTLQFTARIGTTNNIDVGDIFNEGVDADLRGQIITGSATVRSANMVQVCGPGGACYGDFGAGSVSVSFTLNGVTSTVVSTGTLGYYGSRSGGAVSIMDPAPADGGYNNFEVAADSPDGMLQEQIGAMYNLQAAFSAYGAGSEAAPDPVGAIDSVATINGAQLVWGGITLMTPIEHIDAELLNVTVPEPAGLGVLGVLAVAALTRRNAGAAVRGRS